MYLSSIALVLCLFIAIMGKSVSTPNLHKQQIPVKFFNLEEDHDRFQVVHEWKYMDFKYPTFVERQMALANRDFIPENNLPLGVDFYRDRIFITTPRWKDGVPASLGFTEYPPKERSPPISPYPSWSFHGDPYHPDCSKLMSIYRTSIDKCGRLWAIDSGIINASISLNQLCPPKIVAFNLDNDQIISSFQIPSDQVKQDSLHSNIIVDVRESDCTDAYVYVTDVWRFGIVVYSLSRNRSWRVVNYNFLPNPIATDFNIYGLNFQWFDGVFGMSLSPDHDNTDNMFLYFHPMASFKEFMVSTTLLRNEEIWLSNGADVAKYFIEIGDRGPLGQSSTSGIDRSGIMFFTQVHKDDIGCWDTAKPYFRSNLNLLRKTKNISESLIEFPNDLKVDQETVQSVWIMSNKLPIFLYSQLDYNEINFRILRADVERITAGTVCDPVTPSYAKLTDARVIEGQCF